MIFRFGTESIAVNVATREDLFGQIGTRMKRDHGYSLATINLDHIVKLGVNPSFLTAYQAHEFVVADGNPIVWLSRLARKPVDLMPGSDLVVPLAKLAQKHQKSVALFGSTLDTLDEAAAHLCRVIPDLDIVMKIAPEFGFDPSGDNAAEYLRQIAHGGTGLCFLALGAPKQEILAARGQKLAPNTGFVSIGAGLDFLAGNQKRAPQWVQKIALEWAWRMCTNPIRLAPRYARAVLILPKFVLQALRLRRLT